MFKIFRLFLYFQWVSFQTSLECPSHFNCTVLYTLMQMGQGQMGFKYDSDKQDFRSLSAKKQETDKMEIV